MLRSKLLVCIISKHLPLSFGGPLFWSQFWTSGVFRNGSHWRLNIKSSMALADIWAMCGQRNSSGNLKFIISLGTKQKSNRKQEGGMEFESDWTKHRKSSAFTAQR
ncbi:hypothetical protein M9H77_10309 [Catharanthus roseus]|uniref:Uncharacterized protein n=1 Tax=Catharanthus roseus TaxID=4058 RepID=A0ACC0C393_CATRO|nr:hypothetical protein M9H77_10309 [Catharanthus roseus]